MRLGIVAHRSMVGTNYRAIPLAQLETRGYDIHLQMDDVIPERLALCDVVHIYRYNDPRLRAVVRRLRERGVAIIWDNDDDLTAGVDRRRGGLRSQRQEAGIREMLRLAHVVTTPSHALAAQYREWGAGESVVVDNFLPDWFPRERQSRRGEKLVIGWTAGKEHEDDMTALGVTEILTSLLDRHSHVHVASIGVRLGLPSDRYDHIRHVDFIDLAERIAAFDIGIAPLEDTRFNRSRSTVKLKEYAAVDAPWLASPVGPYRELGERQGGLTVADPAWSSALDRLVTSEKTRRKLRKAARRWARSETVEARIDDWAAAVGTAVKLSRREILGDTSRHQ